MHALAELMDNATRFSAAGSEVRVSVQEAEAGALILVEDGGVGLQGRARRRAQVLVSGPADLSTLPGSGLGLASVGRVAARYGLTVSFGPSALGGTTAALMIPRPLVVPAAPDPVPAAAEPGRRRAGPARVAGPAAPRRADLPRRAPGRTLSARRGPAAAALSPDGPPPLSPDRPAPDGPAPDDVAPDDMAPDGPAPDGTAPDGPAADDRPAPGGRAPGSADGPAGPAGRSPDPAARFAAFRQAVGDRAQPGVPSRPDPGAS